jgi:hypothetical protein
MMKAAIFLLILGLGTTKVCGQFNIGLKAGLNLANGSFESEPKTTNLLRFNAGIVSQVSLGKKFLIRSEAVYSQKGYTYPADQYVAGGPVTLSYAIVPVLLGYRAFPKLSLLAGPEIGFLLKDRPGFEKLDYGVSVGSAYCITKNIGAEIRYTYGLAPLFIYDLRNANNLKLGEFRDGFNRVFQVNVFYLFGKR